MKHPFLTLAFALFGLSALLSSCKKEQQSSPNLIFTFRFDSTLARLNNLGQPASMPSGHAAQTPAFNKMSAHYIELAPNALTPLGTGSILYLAPETQAGGSNAIDFAASTIVSNDQAFFTMPLKDVPPGSYEWLRVSLAYQNYDIKYVLKNPLDTTQLIGATGTVASFIGYKTYVTSYLIKNQSITLNTNKSQGYWGFETTVLGITAKVDGQAPAGATTVPNPLFNTSPIPAGSCVVTAQFPQALVITGNETNDITVRVSISVNKSFEWIDVIPDGRYQPDAGEVPVDMGVRGIYPSVN
jgi:hypothetical protein